MTTLHAIPIYKVGAVILRDVATHPQFLLVKPKPKKPNDEAPWVLPRGSRRILDVASGEWVDVRNAEAAERMRDAQWEDTAVTILHELEEEAGVHGINPARLIPIGVRVYRRASGESIPIHWYALILEAADIAAIHAQPSDASEPAQWMTLERMSELAKVGQARSGYVEICKDVLAQVRERNWRAGL